MVTGEVFMAIDVGVPLIAVSAMLIALVLNDQLVRDVNQINAAHRAAIVADDQVAFRHRQTGKHQAEAQLIVLGGNVNMTPRTRIRCDSPVAAAT